MSNLGYLAIGCFARPALLLSAAFAAESLLATLVARGAEVTCVDRLRMTGSSGRELRARLSYGRLASLTSKTCGDAHVDLQARGRSYLLTLSLGAEKVDREVRSINDAATWTESWLEPIVSEASQARHGESKPNDPAEARTPGGTTAGVASGEVPSAGERDSARLPMNVSLGPEMSLGDNGSFWVGPSLFAQYVLAPSFWVGSNAGYAWQLSDSWRRSSLRAALLLGPRWTFAHAFTLSPGVGIGMYSARMREVLGTTRTRRSGGSFFQLLVHSSYAVSRHWSLGSALIGRWHAVNSPANAGELDDEEEGQATLLPPQASPLWDVALRLELICHFGGTP